MGKKVTPEDIETRFRALEEEMGGAEKVAVPAGLTLAAAFIAGAVGLAYAAGARAAKKTSTFVEIRQD